MLYCSTAPRRSPASEGRRRPCGRRASRPNGTPQASLPVSRLQRPPADAPGTARRRGGRAPPWQFRAPAAGNVPAGHSPPGERGGRAAMRVRIDSNCESSGKRVRPNAVPDRRGRRARRHSVRRGVGAERKKRRKARKAGVKHDCRRVAEIVTVQFKRLPGEVPMPADLKLSTMERPPRQRHAADPERRAGGDAAVQRTQGGCRDARRRGRSARPSRARSRITKRRPPGI